MGGARGSRPSRYRELLRETSRGNPPPLPERKDGVYPKIARLLNTTDAQHEHLSEEYQSERAKREKIARAICTLAELLPETRGDYELGPDTTVDELPACEAELVKEGEAFNRKCVAAFGGLLAAVREARESGLPLAPIGAVAPPLDEETEVMATLDGGLASMLPSLGAGHRHRFIAKAVEQITGNPGLNEKKVRDRLE